MKIILAIISVLYINTVFSQEQPIRYYTLSELATATVDSVFAIDLKKMNLTELPDDIFKFKNIMYLDLSKNKLTQTNGLEHFKQLRYLNLEKNKFEYFPFPICQLTELETLILNRNNISVIPVCIEYCQNLKYLDLWGTTVSGLPIEMVHIKTLEKIDLSAVQINKQGQERLREMFPKVKLVLDSPCNCAY